MSASKASNNGDPSTESIRSAAVDGTPVPATSDRGLSAGARDPYKIADVIVPWTREDFELTYDDEQEWPGADYDARVVAIGKSNEALNRARRYLSMNGAAVWQRVERSLADAEALRDIHHGAATVAAITATELTIRFLLLRPAIAGLVFHTRLAMILVREAWRPEHDRRLLPQVCLAWDVDLERLSLPNGEPLWESLKSLIEVRNRYVHRAEPVELEQARGAVDCAWGLLGQVAQPMAERLDLNWPPVGWTHKGRTHDPVVESYDYMGS